MALFESLQTVNISQTDHQFLAYSRNHDILVCPVCDYVDLVKDRFKVHLESHGLSAIDLKSMVRELERDFTTLLSVALTLLALGVPVHEKQRASPCYWSE